MEHLAVADIDLNALAHNVAELRRLSSDARMMAVVKADGYGHGAVPVARTALAGGADHLAVARLSEAVAMRTAGIDAPILLLGHSPAATTKTLIEMQITAAVNEDQAAHDLSAAAHRLGKKLSVHLKIDTGMGRLGWVACTGPAAHGDTPAQRVRKVAESILNIGRLPGLAIEGLFTHFANADSSDKEHARLQFSIFMDLLDELERHGFSVGLRHAANSAATIDMPETHLDMVRPGIALYGLWPSAEVNRNRINLHPVMTFKSRVIGLKSVPAGFPISYGSTYRTSGSTRIATIALGYADGLNRLLSSKGNILIGGRRCPIIGRVCMDLVMVDVSHVPEVAVEDEAVAIGEQKGQHITAEEVAEQVGTINYEIATSITQRVKRIYK
ncbi:MAG: alanine racemase [Proteobacteria bacterium]|nr:MAG: alanine racemase [Pseudomonadota bacterium]